MVILGKAVSKMVEASEARSPYTTSDVTVIHEVYDSENANEKFEMQLETALDSGVKIIVVEPSRLGDETARWIACGNCLHKTAILSGLGVFCTGMIWTERPYLCLPFCVMSVLCTTLYTVSWQFDPCCKYQIEQDYSKLPNLPILKSVSQTASVVLVHRDDNRRKVLHTSVSIIAAVFCAWRIYSSK